MFTKLNRIHTLTYKGVTLNLHEWSKKTGIPFHTIYYRFSKNHTPEKVLSKANLPAGRPKIRKGKRV